MAAFLQYLAAERGASPHTIRSYRADLQDCVGFLERRGLGTLVDADARVVRGYLADLHDRGLARTSIARRLATLRSFFRFLIRRGRVRVNPAREVRTPSLPGRLPAHLPIDQSQALFRHPPGDEVADRRDRAILEVLYATGVRVAELAGLDLEDTDLGEGSVRVLGKGRKERIVPLGSKAVDAVRGLSRRARGLAGPALPERPGRPPHGAEPPPDRPGPRAGGRARRAGHAAHAAPHVRDPSPGRRRGSPPDPGAPRARPAGDHPALHARERGPPGEGLRRGAPAGQGRDGLDRVPRDDDPRRAARRTRGDGRRRAGHPRRRRS